MKAVRVRKHLTSSTLELPELEPLIGKDVEIIVLEETPEKPAQRPIRFGTAKGKIKMSDDFDAPLEDFKEYM